MRILKSVVAAAALSLALVGGARNALAEGEPCTNDIDCPGGGAVCGGEVCSWATADHKCVAEGTSPGWCSGSPDDCKCAGEGATCVGTACTFTAPEGGSGGGGAGSGGSDPSGGTGGTDPTGGSGGSGGADPSGGSSGGAETEGDDGGCSVSHDPKQGFAAGLALVVGLGLGLRRRRRE